MLQQYVILVAKHGLTGLSYVGKVAFYDQAECQQEVWRKYLSGSGYVHLHPGDPRIHPTWGQPVESDL